MEILHGRSMGLAELQAQTGLPPATVDYVVRGLEVNDWIIDKICAALGVTQAEFFGDSGLNWIGAVPRAQQS